MSFRTHDNSGPSKSIVLADSMRSAINMAWEHGGADFNHASVMTSQAVAILEAAVLETLPIDSKDVEGYRVDLARQDSGKGARRFHIFYYLSGISCGSPPQVTSISSPSDERKINHTLSRTTVRSVFPSPS